MSVIGLCRCQFDAIIRSGDGELARLPQRGSPGVGVLLTSSSSLPSSSSKSSISANPLTLVSFSLFLGDAKDVEGVTGAECGSR